MAMLSMAGTSFGSSIAKSTLLGIGVSSIFWVASMFHSKQQDAYNARKRTIIFNLKTQRLMHCWGGHSECVHLHAVPMGSTPSKCIKAHKGYVDSLPFPTTRAKFTWINMTRDSSYGDSTQTLALLPNQHYTIIVGRYDSKSIEIKTGPDSRVVWTNAPQCLADEKL